nr:unnamed protein product [Callosobruchus analis]
MVQLALLRDGCEDTSRSEESSNEIIPDSDSSLTNELSEESQKLRLLEWLREEYFDNRDTDVSKHCIDIESRASTCYSSIGKLSQENIEEASSDSSIIPLGNRISSRKKHHPPDEDSSPCAIISDGSDELRNENLDDESVLTEQASNLNISSVHDPVVPETYSEMKATAIQSRNTPYSFSSETLTKSKKKNRLHHADEKAVQDYLSFPKTTKDGKQMRREILALVRYESDFKIFVQNENPSAERLPCAHCKRIIGVNYLRRHYKKCIGKPINETGRNIRHRAVSQTLVACASDH